MGKKGLSFSKKPQSEKDKVETFVFVDAAVLKAAANFLIQNKDLRNLFDIVF